MTEELFATDAQTEAEFQELMRDPAARQAFVEAKARAAKTGAKVRYSHVLRAVTETPWAIRPSMLALIVDLLAFRVAGGRLTADEVESRVIEGRRQRGHDAAPEQQGVAVLPIEGVIIPKASAMSEVSGGTSLEEFRAQFRGAMADESVKGIVLDVNSPGGMVPGVPEMAQEIRAARGSKPIVAVANHEAASAGYWLASQADKLYVTKSGRVGSIGVYTTHENRAGEAASHGVETTLISAGEFKTEGNPFEPLTDEGKAYMQEQVDEIFSMFVADVAKGRSVEASDVLDGYGQGREVLARQAVQLGMADGVATLEQVVKGMLAAPATAKAVALQANTFSDSDGMMSFEAPVASSTGNTAATISATLPELNQEPGVLAEAESEFMADVDNSAWDGNKAMGQCSNAREYGSICAGEHTYGKPDERQHWALPHHYLGKGPNAAGVRNALSRLPQAEQLANRGRARAHLDAHMRSINPEGSATEQEVALDEEHVSAEDAHLDEIRSFLERVDDKFSPNERS